MEISLIKEAIKFSQISSIHRLFQGDDMESSSRLELSARSRAASEEGKLADQRWLLRDRAEMIGVSDVDLEQIKLEQETSCRLRSIKDGDRCL